MSKSKRVAIIGGGLAGCAAAYVLKNHGLEPVIYEASSSLASGASGNPLGLINPRFAAERNAESEYFTAAFSLAVQIFDSMDASLIDWRKCGALHLMNDEKKEKRFPQTLANWGWPEDKMRMVDADEASRIAGIPLTHQALYLPESGCVSPEKLCAFYALGVEVKTNAPVTDLSALKADAIIIACANGIKNFEETKHLPVQSVRGQITRVRASEKSSALKCNLNYGGYCAPALHGEHIIGATFQRWLDHSDILPEDDVDNLSGLEKIVPDLTQGMDILGGRASLRCSSKDYFPVVGALGEGLYISAAHGSHGIISSLMAAYLLGDMIKGGGLSLPENVASVLSPARFK